MATRTIGAHVGSPNWSSASSWVELAVPTAADDVRATGLSGNLTISANAVCRSIVLTNYGATLTHNAGVTLSVGDGTAGAFTFVAGMTYTKGSATTSAVNFVSTTTGNNITLGGKTLGNVTFSGAGGAWTLQDAFSVGAATVQLTGGTLNTNGQTVTVGNFSGTGATAQTLTLGASSITCSNGGSPWVLTSSNLTFNANTSTITCSGSGVTFDGGTRTYNNVVFSGSGTVIFNDGNTFANLTRTGTAVKTDGLSLFANQTITGTLTLNGNSAINRLLITSDTIGTARTLTAAAVSASNVDFRDITGAGAATWDMSAITGLSGDCGGNSGILLTEESTETWSGTSGGNWSANAWTSRVPLPQDDAVLNKAFSASQTITADMPRLGRTITWAGATGSPTWAITTTCSIYGGLTLISGMTLSGTTVLTFAGRGNGSITSAGKTITNPVVIDAPGSTYSIDDALTIGNTLTLTRGTFDAFAYNVTCTIFTTNSGFTRTLDMGSGTWTLTQTTQVVVWAPVSGGLTFDAQTSTIEIPASNNNRKNFTGANLTYHNFTASDADIQIDGDNTFTGTLAVNNAGAGATDGLKFGGNQTVADFTTNGSAGNLAVLKSSSDGTPRTLTKSGGGIVSVDYMSIRDSAATPDDTWYAGDNSTDVSGNTGWIFTAPPSGNLLLRMMTEGLFVGAAA